MVDNRTSANKAQASDGQLDENEKKCKLHHKRRPPNNHSPHCADDYHSLLRPAETIACGRRSPMAFVCLSVSNTKPRSSVRAQGRENYETALRSVMCVACAQSTKHKLPRQSRHCTLNVGTQTRRTETNRTLSLWTINCRRRRRRCRRWRRCRPTLAGRICASTAIDRCRHDNDAAAAAQ